MDYTKGAVIYTRVSGGEQDKHGTSPETQRDACRAKALALGLPIIAEYYDGGISGGFLLARPGMQAALADIQTGRADTLICANISRYSRDVEHQQAIKKAVKAAGGRLAFCDMDFDDTPEGDMAFGFMGQFAEYEKAVIRKRTMAGRERRAKDGIQTCRTVSPYGYKIIGKADVLRGEAPAEILGKYLIVEDQAAVVRELFTRYAAGAASIMGLTQWINAQNIPTKMGAPFWHTSTVSYILNNPVYKGLGVYGRYDCGHDEARLSQTNQNNGQPIKSAAYSRKADPATWITWPVPAIVSEEEWDAVQSRLSENKAKRSGNPRRVRMLAGHIFCPQCGHGLQVVVADSRPGFERYAQYMCGKHFRSLQSQARGACLPTRYSVPVVEHSVVQALQDAARRPEVVSKALAAYAEALPPEPDAQPKADAARIAQELALLEKKQAAAVQAQIAGIMAGADPSAYSAVFAEIAAQRAAWKDERTRLTTHPTSSAPQSGTRQEKHPKGPTLPAILADLERTLTSPDISGADKRDALGLVIGRVFPLVESGEAPGKRTKNGAARSGGARIEFLPGVFTQAFLPPPGTPPETIQRVKSFSATRMSAPPCFTPTSSTEAGAASSAPSTSRNSPARPQAKAPP